MNPELLSAPHSDHSPWHSSCISIIFSYKIYLSLRRFSPVRAADKLPTLFLNLSKHLPRTIPWVSRIVSVDELRGLAKPLKQPNKLIPEVWNSTSQSCSCPMLTAYQCKQRIWSWNLSLILDIYYYKTLVPTPTHERDLYFPSWTIFRCPFYACLLNIRSRPSPPLPAFLPSTNICWVPPTWQTLCRMYKI